MRTAVMPVRRRSVVSPVPRRTRQAESVVRPAPVGGWNTQDSRALMPASDAPTLDNMFPGRNRLIMRNGSTEHATGVGSGDVETIAEFHVGSTRKLVAAGGGSIYDATSSGAASSLKAGFTSNRWQTASMNGLLGFVNGTDAPQEFNGTTVSAMTVSGSGLTIGNLIGVNIFKSRSYFWESDSQDFWYSAVNAFGGVLTKFPLSRVGSFGGNLVAMGTWTLDSGSGVDDLAVFLMSSGEVIVYAGSNPGDASDWALQGVYRIATPLSIRSLVKFGGDLIVATKIGYVPLSRVLQMGRVGEQSAAFSNKISPTVIEAADNFASNYGWQAVLYPRGSYVLFNVPVSTVTFHQHVMNTLTGAWCRFTGMNGVSWGVYNNRIYFGGTDGRVMLADDGTTDDGSAIMGEMEAAWDYFGNAGIRKSVKALGPVIAAGGTATYGLRAQADFRSATVPDDTYSVSSSLGGSDFWENISDNWEDCTITFQDASADIVRPWRSATAEGYAINSRMKMNSSVGFEVYAMNYLFEGGGAI